MPRFVQSLLIGCLLVIPAVAQRGGGGFHGGMGGFHGGMGGFHGGLGGFRGGGFVSPGFRGGFGNGGFRGFHGGYFWGNRFVGGYGSYWPYYYSAYPYYGYPYTAYSYPYYYNAYPYYGYPYYPYTTFSYPDQDNGYAYSQTRYAYSQTGQTSCPQTNGRPLDLIKLTYQDKVWLTQDYWYTPGTLNFVTLQGELNKTPIDSIDRAATTQLNRVCGVNFQLPR
jgi:hypothetical protein